MGISFGSVSKKPYVGSKEVKEAYVGSQKVYSAAPPIYYGFLGAENDYEIAEWCQLTKGASITKYQSAYRILINGVLDPTRNYITLSEVKGAVLRFTVTSPGSIAGANWPLINWYNASGTQVGGSQFNNRPSGGNFGLVEFTVPANASYAIIRGISNSNTKLYIDALRYETE